MNSRDIGFFGLATAFLGFLVASWLPAYGQEVILSNIRGIVTDPQGAVIVGASVTLTNQNTGLNRAAQTDELGSYLFNDIVPGLYKVAVEFTGFKKYVQTDIDLSTSRTLRINVALEVGDVSQAVTVTGATPVIETESATVSSSARNAEMNAVPTAGSVQGGRIPYTYFFLIPGNAAGQFRGSVGTGYFNGLPGGNAERVTLDGVKVAGACCQIVPTLEVLDEMKVVTHNASAEFATPSTVQLVTRQGGNAFHGDAWWLFDDKSLHARNPFLTEKAIFHGHTFAWSVGGPIIKNKTFFYHGFEGLRFNNTAVSTTTVSPNNVPTAKMQSGDFSELLDPNFVNQFNRGQFITVRDPLSGQAFPSNLLPSGRISPVSTNFIKRFWTVPTAPGLVANQFTNSLRPRQRNKIDVRVDHNFSSRHTFFARYGHTMLNQQLPTSPFTLEAARDLDRAFPGRSASVSDTFIFSPRITNELRAGYTRTMIVFNSPFENEDVMAAAGLQGTLGIRGIPALAFSGTGSFTGIAALTSFPKNVSETYGVTDNVAIAFGAHRVKFGFQFNRDHSYSSNAIAPPTFSFDGRLSGWSWADFMLGLPSSVTRSLAAASSYVFSNEWGLYVQDEIQATRGVTLQLGIRYTLWGYPYEKWDKWAIFDPSRVAIVVPSAQSKQYVVPTFPQNQIPVLTAEEARYPSKHRSLFNTDINNWAPRIGVAWRPFGATNTVVRGGYGLYFYNDLNTGASAGGALFTGSQTLTQQLSGNVLVPTIAFPNPFVGFQGAVNLLNPQTLNFNAGNPNVRNPYVHEYSLSIERDLKGWGARFSYLGSLQNRVAYSRQINFARPNRQPFDQNRRPIPQVREIGYTDSGGFSRAHGFQFEVKRPFAHGFLLNASYTWMKRLTDVGAQFGGGTALDRRQFKSNPFMTPRHQLILTYMWDVPVGRNRTFLQNLHPVLNGVVGGWQITGASKFQSGLYLTPFYVGADPMGLFPGTGQQLPDRIADGNLPREQRSPFTGRAFFDTAAFVCPGGSSINGLPNLLSAGCPQSTPQNVGRYGNSSPNIIEGPGINTWNMSIGKEFGLPREGASVDFAAWIANPWNHPTYEVEPNMNLSSPASVGRYVQTRNDFIEPFSYGNRRIALRLRVRF